MVECLHVARRSTSELVHSALTRKVWTTLAMVVKDQGKMITPGAIQQNREVSLQVPRALRN